MAILNKRFKRIIYMALPSILLMGAGGPQKAAQPKKASPMSVEMGSQKREQSSAQFGLPKEGQKIAPKKTKTRYLLESIELVGNTRLSNERVSSMLTLREGGLYTKRELQRKVEAAKAKMMASRLFMFVDLQLIYEDHQPGGQNGGPLGTQNGGQDGAQIGAQNGAQNNRRARLFVSMGENVILLDMAALQQGSFTRFRSITPGSPDFGFLVGPQTQFLYLRFNDILGHILNQDPKLPAGFVLRLGHEAYLMEPPERDQTNLGEAANLEMGASLDEAAPSDYEGFYARLVFDPQVVHSGGSKMGGPFWQNPFLNNFDVEFPIELRKNTSGGVGVADTLEAKAGISFMLDLAHYKDSLGLGVDLGASYLRAGGFGDFDYQDLRGWAQFYAKPIDRLELVSRLRAGTLWGEVPPYAPFHINHEYFVRGDLVSLDRGSEMALWNVEARLLDLVKVKAAISDIEITLMAFADFGAASDTLFDDLAGLKVGDWNLAAGAALEIEFKPPLNMALQIGYGEELRLGGGARFYIKMGYDFYAGDFYE